MHLRAIEPFTLCGHGVRLRPAEPDDAEPMHRAADPATFALFTVQPTPWSIDGCSAYLERVASMPATMPLTLLNEHTGEIIGGTSYCDIRAEHRGVEIGWTWITPRLRGTHVNPAMKLLLLEHAFETDLFPQGPAVRVTLKTHHKNLRSQAAISKLGAVREGTLRKHVIMPDGSFRDSVFYSITDEQWPDVRHALRDRLATHRQRGS
ncbi:MAG: GNAT family protein [Planctomycetota bacterium]